ncbi:MAG: hypothetical protein IJA56_02360 [Clostridia bacterium]|nr:hypothetical protein [Clostridia bacterium]
MKPLKWQQDDPELARGVRAKGNTHFSPWWDTAMNLLDTVIVLIQAAF